MKNELAHYLFKACLFSEFLHVLDLLFFGMVYVFRINFLLVLTLNFVSLLHPIVLEGTALITLTDPHEDILDMSLDPSFELF